MRDEVILGWAEGNPSAQEILAQGGIEQLRDSPIVPGFVAAGGRGLRGVRRCSPWCSPSFFVDGHGWARLVLTATARSSACWSAPVCLDDHLPTVFVVLSAARSSSRAWCSSFFLWQRETTRLPARRLSRSSPGSHPSASP